MSMFLIFSRSGSVYVVLFSVLLSSLVVSSVVSSSSVLSGSWSIKIWYVLLLTTQSCIHLIKCAQAFKNPINANKKSSVERLFCFRSSLLAIWGIAVFIYSSIKLLIELLFICIVSSLT